MKKLAFLFPLALISLAAAAPQGAGGGAGGGASADPAREKAPVVPAMLLGRWGQTTAHCSTGGDGNGVVSFTANTVTIDGMTGLIPAPITRGQTYFRARVEFAPRSDAAGRAPVRRDLSFSVTGRSTLNLSEFVERRRQPVGTYRRCA